MFIGIAIVIIGVVFLLQNMGLVSGSAWSVIWPSLLVVLGLSMMSKDTCCNMGKAVKSKKEDK